MMSISACDFYVESVLNIQLFLTSVSLLCMDMSSLSGACIFYSQLLCEFEQTAAIQKPAEQQFATEWERWYPKIRRYAQREISQPLKKKLQRLQVEEDLHDGMNFMFLIKGVPVFTVLSKSEFIVFHDLSVTPSPDLSVTVP